MATAALDPPTSSQKQHSGQSSKAVTRKRSDSNSDGNEVSRKESLGGALARSLLGSLAFFFRLPIRLFRPVKLSSWTVLESFAKRERTTLSLSYVLRLLRRENNRFMVHLLAPPMLINTVIGFALFESYSLTEARLLRRHHAKRARPDDGHQGNEQLNSNNSHTEWTPLWIVALAGSAAGAAQCILSAPLDNVRLVLSSHKQDVKRRGRAKGAFGQTRSRRYPSLISWRAVFRAALLPFAPEQAHQRLVHAVKQTSKDKQAVVASRGENGILNATQRRIWQQRLRRLGGSVHGAGLIMSLARDSVGFSSFFVIFEASRRVAHGTSTAVDRTIAWWSATSALPGSNGGRVGDVETDDDFYHVQAKRADISYNASRTKTGRVVAAFVLIVGGAFGAFAYEAVGRPFELMRLIIWQGRQKWQKQREQQTKRRAAGARGQRQSWFAKRRRMDASTKRVKIMAAAANSSASRLESLLTLRAANSAGTRSPRSHAFMNQSHPPHPLRSLAGVEHGQLRHRKLKGEKLSNKGHTTTAKQRTTTRQQLGHHEPHVSKQPPGALALLLEHAENTSTLAYTSASRKFRTAVPGPILLLHTYFLAPYLTSLSNEALVAGSSGTGKPTASSVEPAKVSSALASNDAAPAQEGSRAQANRFGRLSVTTRSAARLLSEWVNKNPVSSSIPGVFGVNSSRAPSTGSTAGLQLSYLPPRPQTAPGYLGTLEAAHRWGSGRTAWALRRCLTPYGIGFVIFAWMSGDV
ncbi:unnamed protein product [Jaminaea pallidilutea]